MAELYLDGTWVGASTKARREIRCPADGTLVAEVDEGGPEDTERAIAAAHRAFHEGPWPTTPARERGALLLKVADLLERDTTTSPGWSRSTPASGSSRASTTSPTSSRCSGTSAGWPPRTPVAWSTPATPTWSAGSCTSRSASVA